MKRNRAITILIVLAIVSIIAGALISVMMKQTVSGSINKQIEITDGKSTVTEFSFPIELKHSGDYSLSLEFITDDDPGFITAFELINSNGQSVNWSSAALVTIEDAAFKLTKGTNYLNFTIMSNNTQYEEMFRAKLPELAFSAWDGFSDGSTVMQYNIHVERSYKDVGTVIAVFACIAGGCIGAALSMSLRKGEKAKGDYDERMKIARYKSEAHAFYVLLAGMLLIFSLNFGGLVIPVEFSAQIMFVLCAGLSVMAVEGILNDGYFALNDRKRGFTILFFIMFLFMGGLSVIIILRGEMVIDGVLQNTACFIFLALMSLSCVIAEFVHDKREEVDD